MLVIDLSRHRMTWGPDEDEFIRRYAKEKTDGQIALQLARTAQAVRERRRHLGVHRPSCGHFTPQDRFMARVLKSADGCWLWQGPLNKGGYGQFYLDGQQGHAHRAAYKMFVAPVPDGMVVDHICRVRACVNPVHLRPLTNAENVLIGVGITAKNLTKTHCKRGHELAGDNLIPNKDSKRICRTCHYAHGAKNRQKAEYKERMKAYKSTPEYRAKASASQRARMARKKTQASQCL